MRPAADYTANEVTEAIHRALQARDLPGATALMHRLAVLDPTPPN